MAGIWTEPKQPFLEQPRVSICMALWSARKHSRCQSCGLDLELCACTAYEESPYQPVGDDSAPSLDVA
jgi:hypothetical protein